MPKLAEPPGEALSDWQILTLFAREMGYKREFAYESAEEVFAEYADLTKDRHRVRSLWHELSPA